MTVLPPAYGKKMWRVRRTVSTGSADIHEISSLECMNSSLKIAAAAKEFMVRRPPMKRPKTKSGQPKDFVFVDLSPTKSDVDEVTETSDSASASSTASAMNNRSPFSMNNESFASLNNSDEEASHQSYFDHGVSSDLLEDDSLLGLGLVDINYNFGEPQALNSAPMVQSDSFELSGLHTGFTFPPSAESCSTSTYAYGEQQLPTPVVASSSTHRRTQSTSAIPRRKSAGGFQFKTYTGPGIKKPSAPKRVRKSLSQPTQHIVTNNAQLETPGLDPVVTPVLQCTGTPQVPAAPMMDDYSHLSRYDLDSESDLDLTYSPIREFSDVEYLDSLLQPINLDVFPTNVGNPRFFKEDFDMSPFITI